MEIARRVGEINNQKIGIIAHGAEIPQPKLNMCPTESPFSMGMRKVNIDILIVSDVVSVIGGIMFYRNVLMASQVMMAETACRP